MRVLDVICRHQDRSRCLDELKTTRNETKRLEKRPRLLLTNVAFVVVVVIAGGWDAGARVIGLSVATTATAELNTVGGVEGVVWVCVNGGRQRWVALLALGSGRERRGAWYESSISWSI